MKSKLSKEDIIVMGSREYLVIYTPLSIFPNDLSFFFKSTSITLIMILCAFNVSLSQTAPYPQSTLIQDVSFDWASHDQRAPGSDNWPMTWADDDHQYSSWGDGGGFGGTNSNGRVSLGFARIEGIANNYQGFNVWGGYNPENPAQFGGKCYGIISINGTLYMWRSGDASGTSAYDFQELYRSTNHAATWQFTGVKYTQDTFPNSDGWYCPTFLQFGRDYAGARDNYVYMYGVEIKQTNDFLIHTPGEIMLVRVDTSNIEDQNQYEYFAGLDGNNNPTWTSDVASREPVFEDPNGIRLVSVAYNSGLARYFLTTEHTSAPANGNLAMFESSDPWGPWRTVLYEFGWGSGHIGTQSSLIWSFSPKWWSSDGKDFVLVFSGRSNFDSWNSIKGSFILAPQGIDSAKELFQQGFNLHQNYPNPFNPSTNIRFSIPTSEFVILKVYDILGREVDTLFSDHILAGNHAVEFDATDLESGLYFYKIQAGKYYDAKKMLVIK